MTRARQVLRLFSPLLFAMLAAASTASCSGGGGDDGDGGSPTPTPGPVTSCQLLWVTRDPPGQSDVVDYYLVDAPLSSWVSGDEAFYLGDPDGITNVTGAWVDDYDLVDREWAQAALATSGVFTLTLTSGADRVAAGMPVGFEDVLPQAYYLLGPGGELTSSIGPGGTGTFDGVWSDPASADVEEGSGTITIAYFGSAMTLGVDLAYGKCYAASSAFAPPAREETLRQAGDRAGALLHR